MGIIGLIVIGIYVYLGDKANYYLKYHLLNVRAELYGDTFNYLLKRAVAGAFLGWATIPVAIIHYLLTSKTSSSRNTDMDAPEEIDNNMDSVPRNRETKPSFISGLMQRFDEPARKGGSDDPAREREVQQVAFIARDSEGYIRLLLQGSRCFYYKRKGNEKADISTYMCSNTNQTKSLKEVHWMKITEAFDYWDRKAYHLGVGLEKNKNVEIAVGFKAVVNERYLKETMAQLPHLKDVASKLNGYGFLNCINRLWSGKQHREYMKKCMEKFDLAGWTVENIPSQYRPLQEWEESDQWVMEGWEERGHGA